MEPRSNHGELHSKLTGFQLNIIKCNCFLYFSNHICKSANTAGVIRLRLRYLSASAHTSVKNSNNQWNISARIKTSPKWKRLKAKLYRFNEGELKRRPKKTKWRQGPLDSYTALEIKLHIYKSQTNVLTNERTSHCNILEHIRCCVQGPNQAIHLRTSE